jgi:hypothetical protein
MAGNYEGRMMNDETNLTRATSFLKFLKRQNFTGEVRAGGLARREGCERR